MPRNKNKCQNQIYILMSKTVFKKIVFFCVNRFNSGYMLI